MKLTSFSTYSLVKVSNEIPLIKLDINYTKDELDLFNLLKENYYFIELLDKINYLLSYGLTDALNYISQGKNNVYITIKIITNSLHNITKYKEKKKKKKQLKQLKESIIYADKNIEILYLIEKILPDVKAHVEIIVSNIMAGYALFKYVTKNRNQDNIKTLIKNINELITSSLFDNYNKIHDMYIENLDKIKNLLKEDI